MSKVQQTIIVILALCFTAACTKTNIHIISQGYSKEELTNIKQSLTNTGHKVLLSSASVPKEFPNNAITMNPGFSDIKVLTDIKTILRDYGITNSTEYRFAEGKHFYHKGHIGIYIRNPDMTTKPMPAYLRTQYCKAADATIQFKDGQEFVLEYEENIKDEQLTKINGRYTFDGKILLLTVPNSTVKQYNYVHELKSTYVGDRPADVYKPVSTNHKVRPFNCEFLIIYME